MCACGDGGSQRGEVCLIHGNQLHMHINKSCKQLASVGCVLYTQYQLASVGVRGFHTPHIP